MAITATRPTASRITATRPTATSINAGGGGEVCRWFSNFNGTSSYAEMTSDIVLAGDFEVRFSLTPNNISGTQSFLGDDNGVDDFIGVAGFEKLFYRFSGVSTGTGLFVTSDEVNDIIIKRAGSSVSSLINGVEEVDTNAGAFTLNALGSRNGQNNKYFGQLSNLEIWEGGDSTTGTKIMNMAMDERYLNVRGEILYNNSAVKDDWYLSFMDNAEISVKELVLVSDFVIKARLTRANTDAGTREMALAGKDDTLNKNFIVLKDTLNPTPNAVTIRFNNGADINFLNALPSTLGAIYDFELRSVSNNLELFIDGVSQGVQSISESLLVDVIGSSDMRRFFENISMYSFEVWQTGTKVLDYNFQSLSNVIVNQADTPSANSWDDDNVTIIGESTRVDGNTYNILSTTGDYTEINSSIEDVSGKDVLVIIELIAGSLDNIIVGGSSVEFTGWENIRDTNNQPIPKMFQTVTNRPLGSSVLIKRTGICDATITNITAQTVQGYGVLNGTRNTDYEYKNDSPHAIGYNITVTKECEGDASAWNDPEGFNDPEEWND